MSMMRAKEPTPPLDCIASQSIRTDCIARKNCCGEAIDLGVVWDELIDGRLRIVRALHSSERCYAALLTCQQPAIRNDAATILRRVLRGESQKIVASSMGVSVPNIAQTCGDALAAISIGRGVLRAPLLLVVAAHASATNMSITGRIDGASETLKLVSAGFPTLFRSSLSPAEAEVTHLLLTGRDQATVARLGHKSPRTIANQVASAFRKVGISGMSEFRSLSIRQQYAANENELTQQDAADLPRESSCVDWMTKGTTIRHCGLTH